jgi:hypothetical protein
VPPAELHDTWLQRVKAAPTAPLQQLQLQMLAERQSPENLHARFAGVTRAVACPPLPLDAGDIVVLDCDDDPIIPAAARDRLRARYRQAGHVRLPSGGHYPHVRGNPDPLREPRCATWRSPEIRFQNKERRLPMQEASRFSRRAVLGAPGRRRGG